MPATRRIYKRLHRIPVTTTIRLGLPHSTCARIEDSHAIFTTLSRVRRKLRPRACHIPVFLRDFAKIQPPLSPGFVRATHSRKTSLVLTSTIVTCAMSLIHSSFVFSWQCTLEADIIPRADRKMIKLRFPCVLLASGQSRADTPVAQCDRNLTRRHHAMVPQPEGSRLFRN